VIGSPSISSAGKETSETTGSRGSKASVSAKTAQNAMFGNCGQYGSMEHATVDSTSRAEKTIEV
jgi:hypothetical protein